MFPLRSLTRTFALIVSFAALSTAAFAQVSAHPGVELFRQGKTDQAIVVLEAAVKQKEFGSSGEIWNTLGLAYFTKKDLKKAAKAFETAVRVAPDAADHHGNLAFVYLLSQKPKDARKQAEIAARLDPKSTAGPTVLGRLELFDNNLDEANKYAQKVIELRPASPDGYMLRSDILLAKLGNLVGAGWDVRDEVELLQQAYDVLTKGAERSRAHPDYKAIETEAEAVGAFYDHYSKEPATPTASPTPLPANVTPIKFIKKPLPGYTDQARSWRISGRVTLAVLFGADGTVHHALLLQKLGYGLDEVAVAAALRIRFIPQAVDGKPVSVVKTVEYTFSTY